MSGPYLALEQLAKPADVDERGRTGRVHLFDGGEEGEVHAELLEHREVSGLVARVPGEVLVRPELGRVDEDARRDRGVVASRAWRTSA